MTKTQGLDTVLTNTNAIVQPLWHALLCWLDPPPLHYILTLVKPFCFDWHVIPLLKTGVLASTRDLFLRFWRWKHQKKLSYPCPIYVIGHNTCPMVASSGFLCSTGPPPLGDARGYVPGHCHGHQNGHLFRCICWLLFVCLLPLRPLGQYIASSHPMAVSSGFRSSPGHAVLGNAICIAPAHCRGHQNGWRTRCIFCHRQFCHRQ